MHNTSKSILAAIVLAAFNVTPSFAGLADVDNVADILHPNIHDKVGDGSNASPTNNNPNGGAEIHGIGNTPGQNDEVDPRDGAPGFADQLGTVHGGISEVNQNTLP